MTKKKKQACVNCSQPKSSVHTNTKYCEKCRAHFLSKPKSTLTKEQREEAKGMIGKFPREEIAEHLGCSLANLKRAFRGKRLAYHNKWARQPDLVKEVCRVYEAHGMVETRKRYPGIQIRSIVERYKYFKPRQIRWTETEIIEAAKMSGIISKKSQSVFFNRPGANAGSITALWQKRFGFGGGCINGMSKHQGRYLVSKECPMIKTAFWHTRRQDKQQKIYSRQLYLWVDMEKNLKPETEPFITEAIITMANFQRWLFNSPAPRLEILRLFKEREFKNQET